MKNTEWDKLETRRTEEITTTTYTEKILPEGVYACPHCNGTGKAEIGYSFRDGIIYTTCGMCKGTGEIRKCTQCNINPIPNDDNTSRCYNCNKVYYKQLTDTFTETVNKGVK